MSTPDGPHASGTSPSSSSVPPRIALVGHCGPDSWMLKSVVGRAVPGAEIVMVGTQAQAVEEASRANLLLINRVLDGEFADDSGVELIRRLAGGAGGGAVGGAGGKDGMRATLMLVSNYADAQAEAVAAGGGAAVPGFGKSSAGTAATAAAIRAGAARK